MITKEQVNMAYNMRTLAEVAKKAAQWGGVARENEAHAYEAVRLCHAYSASRGKNVREGFKKVKALLLSIAE